MTMQIFFAVWFLFLGGFVVSSYLTMHALVSGFVREDAINLARFFLYGILAAQFGFFTFLPILISMLSLTNV